MMESPISFSGRVKMSKVEPLVYNQRKRLGSSLTSKGENEATIQVGLWQRVTEVFLTLLAVVNVAIQTYSTIVNLVVKHSLKAIIYSASLYTHSATVAIICLLSVYKYTRQKRNRRGFYNIRQFLKPNILIASVIVVILSVGFVIFVRLHFIFIVFSQK